MEAIAIHGMDTVHKESVGVGAGGVSGSLPSERAVPEPFDEQLAKAELAFWDEHKGTTQPGLKNLAAEITYTLSGFKSLHLSMDQERQQVVVRVVDKQTHKVVRQLPSRQMVDLVKQMRDLEGVLCQAIP